MNLWNWPIHYMRCSKIRCNARLKSQKKDNGEVLRERAAGTVSGLWKTGRLPLVALTPSLSCLQASIQWIHKKFFPLKIYWLGWGQVKPSQPSCAPPQLSPSLSAQASIQYPSKPNSSQLPPNLSPIDSPRGRKWNLGGVVRGISQTKKDEERKPRGPSSSWLVRKGIPDLIAVSLLLKPSPDSRPP